MNPSPNRPPAVQNALAFIQGNRERSFAEVALEVVRFQAEANEPYRRLCERRGLDAGGLAGWEDAPWVPTGAFKSASLRCGPARHVFWSSGTSRGPAERSRHELPELDLYEASWAEPFRRHLVPDRESISIVSLIPMEKDQRQSSLSFMVDRVLRTFGTKHNVVAMGKKGLDLDAVRGAFARAGEKNDPLLILGTAFAFVHLLDTFTENKEQFVLPEGSRLMDTGGFKGRSRSVTREALLAGYEERLGILPSHVVGEYGMTELCSQFYQTGLGTWDGPPGAGRRYESPPWVKTRVLDPVSLRTLPSGETGLLAHFDLANAWTVSPVLTEDMGREVDGGFEWKGRAEGADLRGCSLTTEELLG